MCEKEFEAIIWNGNNFNDVSAFLAESPITVGSYLVKTDNGSIFICDEESFDRLFTNLKERTIEEVRFLGGQIEKNIRFDDETRTIVRLKNTL